MALSDFFKDKINEGESVIKAKFKKYIKKLLAPIVAGVCICGGGLVLMAGAAFGDYFPHASGGVSGASSGGSSSGMQSASEDSWEQFLRFVLTNEGGTKTADGNYYIVEDDSVGNPTVGHGLCLKDISDGIYLHVNEFAAYGIDSKALADAWLSGDRSGKVEVSICDTIWRENLENLYNSISTQYPNLKIYQQYALVDVKYRRGNTNGFQSAYDSKWTAADDKYGNYVESQEPYSTSSLYSFFNNGYTNTRSGVYRRKKDQWLLFKYGYYRALDEYAIIGSAGSGGSGGSATGFWWPIEAGSDGRPLSTAITAGREFKSSHLGIDINRGSRSESPKIIASYDGVVDTVVNYAGHASSPNYGTYVILKHNYNGVTYYTYYPHMVYNSIPSNIREGGNVSAGTVLGTMGDTGYSFGIHLHFEIRKGSKSPRNSVAVNPLEYVNPNNPYPTD